MNDTITQIEHPVNGKTVLLVDDDKFLLDMYIMKFVKEGYIAHGCLSVSDALKTLHSGLTPDAVVFDLTMPEYDGFYLLKTIHEENLAPHAVLIALSNQMEDADRTRAKELGADDFIVKATKIPSEVVNIVTELIQKYHKA